MGVAGARALRTMSILPGRVRWEVTGLRDDPALARRLVDALRCEDRVTSASANAASGRILIEFDPALSLEKLEDSIEAVLNGHSALTPVASAPAPVPALTFSGHGVAARAGSAALRWTMDRTADDIYAQQAVVLLGGLLYPRVQRLRQSLYGAAAANVVGVLRLTPIAFAMDTIAHERTGPLGTVPTVGIMAAAATGGTLLRGRLRQRSQVLWNSVGARAAARPAHARVGQGAARRSGATR